MAKIKLFVLGTFTDSLGFQAWLQERRAYYQPLLAGLKRPTEQRLLAGDLVGNLVAAQGKPLAHTANPAEPAERMNGTFPTPALAVDGLDAVPDMGAFYGRQSELNQLHQWVVGQPGAPRARLVALLGMGGEGKSALAAHFIRSLASLSPAAHDPGEAGGAPMFTAGAEPGLFAHILWTSLLNAPPLAEVLQRWVQALSAHQVSQLPPSLDRQLTGVTGITAAQKGALLALGAVTAEEKRDHKTDNPTLGDTHSE